MQVTHRIVLHFPPAISGRPIVYHLARDYKLAFNILKASIGLADQGLMVMELSGEEADYQQATEFLLQQGVRIQPLLQDIRKDDESCVDCGACVAVCPSSALVLERPSMRVALRADACVACGECVPACPVRAIELRF
jgi:ferredoxin